MALPSLTTVFEATCRAHGARIAVATTTDEVSYGELRQRAARFAAALGAHGVGPGARVAIWLPNGVDWVVAHWGIALRGAIVVPIGTRLRASEASYLIGQSEACALVMTDRLLKCDYLSMLAEIKVDLPALKTIVVRATGPIREDTALSWDSFLAADGRPDDDDDDDDDAGLGSDDVHIIQYTSGTTGYPKGAVLGQAGLLTVASSHAASWALAPGEAVFIPNPFSHIMGMVLGVLVPVVTGATLVTMPVFDAAEALALIARHGAVALAGTPSHYLALADCAEPDRSATAGVRVAMSGGAPLLPATVRRIATRLGFPAILNGYGMSEASGSITRTSKEETTEASAGSIGHPMPWLETLIVDVDTGAAGETGELWIRGPGVLRGYFRMPDATATALTADGWLKTGDLVRRRSDGAFEIVGRLKDMLLVGGFTVYPAEVERVLLENGPFVAACVVGVPDARLGEAPFAFVKLRPGATADENAVFATMKARIAGYKVPRFIELVSDLPLLGSGKVDRLSLRAEAGRLAPAKARLGSGG